MLRKSSREWSLSFHTWTLFHQFVPIRRMSRISGTKRSAGVSMDPLVRISRWFSTYAFRVLAISHLPDLTTQSVRTSSVLRLCYCHEPCRMITEDSQRYYDFHFAISNNKIRFVHRYILVDICIASISWLLRTSEMELMEQFIKI